ncbi:hypothetical protein E4650_07805 [Geotoga petraea]|uniref:Multisubunit sodium/proton antiporter, MrpF subunit n=1 Tax=Geotoga petraea TaxID=28234 RepID=A0A4Z0VZX2_9BACT|nr:hypothetical protein E4650_07805 [Geotoga petraea]
MNNYVLNQILIIIPFFLTLIKLFMGPNQWERLLAYTSFSSKITVIMLLYIFYTDQFFLLDMIIIFSLLNVWGVLIATKFLEKGR